jgi:hypothetical protein
MPTLIGNHPGDPRAAIITAIGRDHRQSETRVRPGAEHHGRDRLVASEQSIGVG